MMKLRKIWALVLAVAMIALVGAAFADGEATLTGGEIGGSTFPTDNPSTQSKSIKIAKELTVYNVDEAKIYAPTISYTYTVAAGDADKSITDATSDHGSGVAVNVSTKAGSTTGLKVNGTAGTTGTVAWAATEVVDAATDGAANLKYLTLDFSEVVFGAAGVYRYEISEALTSGYAYNTSGVTETDNTTNPHTRYLDVYVRPAPTGFTDGTLAADWDIYGYVCMVESEDITPDGDTTTTGAVKTNGFVAGSNDSTAYTADSYYTYNLAISKDVENDAYAKATVAFPFTVIFGNSAITQDVHLAAETGSGVTAADVTTYTTAGAPTWASVIHIKDVDGTTSITDLAGDNGSINANTVKLIGIPNGVDAEVYETNIVNGVTYLAATSVNSGTATTENIVFTTTTPSGVVQAGTTLFTAGTKTNAYESTKTVVDTTANADDDTVHSIAITNTLQLISPTGYVARFAPYALMLIGGIALLLVAKKHRRHAEEEDK